MNSPNPPHVKLAPPGAGLGFITEFFLRWYINPFVAQKASWQQCEETFIKLHKKILDTLESIPCRRRV